MTDLPRSKAFYEAVGAVNNPAFTDDTTACMVLSETIHIMLLTQDRWRQFTSKPIVDAHANAQMLLCLSANSRDDVSSLVDKATKPGGKADPTPTQDYGFKFGRSFEDLDGHIWKSCGWTPAPFRTAEQECVSAPKHVAADLIASRHRKYVIHDERSNLMVDTLHPESTGDGDIPSSVMRHDLPHHVGNFRIISGVLREHQTAGVVRTGTIDQVIPRGLCHHFGV